MRQSGPLEIARCARRGDRARARAEQRRCEHAGEVEGREQSSNRDVMEAEDGQVEAASIRGPVRGCWRGDRGLRRAGQEVELALNSYLGAEHMRLREAPKDGRESKDRLVGRRDELGASRGGRVAV